MEKCELCGEEGNLREIKHKQKGKIKVCDDCREEVYKEGKAVPEGTGLTCSHC